MSVSLELVKTIAGTGLSRRIDHFVVKVFGKKVVSVTSRDVVKQVAKALERADQESVRLFEALMLAEASQAIPKLRALFPEIMKGVDEQAFAELVQIVSKRGRRSSEAVRGLIVERLLRAMPEFEGLLDSMDLIVAAANKRGKGWGPARLAHGVVDGHGKEVGDLLIVSQHKDGRLWVLAVVESKSFSNASHLGHLKDLDVGQHLWDWARAKSRGLFVDGTHYKRSKLEFTPVPTSDKVEAGVVGAKTVAKRVDDASKGLYTQFIGFVPKKLGKADVLRVADQGIQIEVWEWQFDLDLLDKFQKKAADVIGLGSLKL